MKNYLLIIVALVAFSTTSFAQLFGKHGDGETLTYSDLNANTGGGFIRGDLGILDMGISKTFMMSLDPQITALYKNFYAKLEYTMTYVDLNLASDPILASSVNGDLKKKNFEFLAGYYFRNEKEGKIPITLKSENIGSRITLNTITHVDANYEWFVGPEAGMATGYNLLHVDGKFDVEQLSAKNVWVKTTTPGDVGNSHFTTMQDYTFLNIGAAFGTITDVSATFSEYGEKSNRAFLKYYVNIIIPMRNNIDDIFWTTKANTNNSAYTIPAYSTRYRLDNTVPKSGLGWRIGAEVHYFSVFSLGAELAVLPGISQDTFDNVYATVKCRIGIPYRF